MAPPLISVVVPTFRRFEPLLRTVNDLLEQDYPHFEIIVADQNQAWPSDLTESVNALKAHPRVRWMTFDRPGVVAARNRAVAMSEADIVLFVDDDVFVPSRSLLTHHARCFEDPSIAAVAGRERSVGDAPADVPYDAPSQAAILPPPPSRSPLQQTLWFNRNGASAQRVCAFSTCNGAIRRLAFLAVGGFDELFAGNSYGDDSDLALRLHDAGLEILYEPSAWLIHRMVPLGGLRMGDPGNRQDGLATAQGLWLFVLRHGHQGMFGHLVLRHVLRKTILLKRNLLRPWREPLILAQVIGGLLLAVSKRSGGPRSPFNHPGAPAVSNGVV